MNSRILNIAYLCLVPMLFTSCMTEKKATTDSTSATIVQINALSTAVSDAQEKIGAVSELTPGDSNIVSLLFKKNLNFLMSSAMATIPTEFGDDWEINSPFQDPAYCGSECSPTYPGGSYHDRSIKYWMQAHLDKNFKRGNGSSANVFGKMNNSFQMICAIGQLLEVKDGGYPANGPYNLIITQNKLTVIMDQCHMEVNNPDEILGMQIQIVVSDAETTTIYDKKLTLVLPEGNTGVLYLRNNAGFINIGNSESGEHGQSRSLISYDRINKKIFFEFVSAAAGTPGNSMYVYRIFHNEISDKGYIMALEGGGDNGYQDTRFTLAGKPNSGGTLALSLSRTQGPAIAAKKACVNLADGSIATDGSLSCSLQGVSIEDAALTSLLADAISHRNDNDWSTLTSELGVGFTDETTMFTLNVAK